MGYSFVLDLQTSTLFQQRCVAHSDTQVNEWSSYPPASVQHSGSLDCTMSIEQMAC